ncbi:33408_t:CDS:2, partial [Racocetra persica]
GNYKEEDLRKQYEEYSKEKNGKVKEININEQLSDQLYPAKNTNPAKRRNKLETLNISEKELEGSLDLTDFTNLKKLYCNDNKLTSLKLNNLTKLETIFCFNNQLTNLGISASNNLENLNCKINQLTDINSLLSNLNSAKLKQLDLRDNDFSESDLTYLSKFVNLEYLELSNNYQKVSDDVFYQSFKPLQYLNKLESLYVKDSSSNRNVYFSSNKKDGSVAGQIRKLISREINLKKQHQKLVFSLLVGNNLLEKIRQSEEGTISKNDLRHIKYSLVVNKIQNTIAYRIANKDGLVDKTIEKLRAKERSLLIRETFDEGDKIEGLLGKYTFNKKD